ncbi:cAMP phosphodiesterase class-II [Phlyctema vagabunda]|uniref:cAMP phosphodiesterase class-II n=1 Tax=Phlyctema vagabunda TaxID=108571 RepID=A0ABR4PRJ9_9HELO
MVHGKVPALQVIVLGSGGGPREDNTTAFLVRSTALQWSKGSVLAVDAGVQLAAIARILEPYLPEDDVRPAKLTGGPFEGLEIPHSSADANAAYITGTLVDTYLITHPHLDHISGFVVNTASLSGSRPKRLAGLPATILAFKTHIFNNIIWPNLSDENNGAGLVTYMRLVDGGSPAADEGYLELCEGLAVKTWGVSHGHCIEGHSHRAMNTNLHAVSGNLDGVAPSQTEPSPMRRSISRESPNSYQHRNRRGSGVNYTSGNVYQVVEQREVKCVYDSSAHFIRDMATGQEVLIFGDVEPDSLSLDPRNGRIWLDAAPRIVSGKLRAIFIECSYDDSRDDSILFGHMAPRHLAAEFKALAAVVAAYKGDTQEIKLGKRKRPSNGNSIKEQPASYRRSPRLGGSPVPGMRSAAASPLSQPPDAEPQAAQTSIPIHLVERPLRGLKIVIVHVKSRLDDGPDEGDTILDQLNEYEAEMKLGCEFIISRVGQSLYL